jgi:hypothetical protein
MNGRVDIDRACNGLEELGMKYAAEALSQFLNTPVKESWAPHTAFGCGYRGRAQEA